MTYSELKRKLTKCGCRFHHDGKNHEIWVNRKGVFMTIGRHATEEVPKGTLQNIKKWAGMK